jgi:hypothetical protein
LAHSAEHAPLRGADRSHAHFQVVRDDGRRLATDSRPQKRLPSSLFKFAPNQFQRAMSNAARGVKFVARVTFCGQRIRYLEKLTLRVAASDGIRPGCMLAKVIVNLVFGNRVQPTSKAVARLVVPEPADASRNGAENLLDNIGCIAVLKSGPPAPAIDEQTVQPRQPLPSIRIKVYDPLGSNSPKLN